MHDADFRNIESSDFSEIWRTGSMDSISECSKSTYARYDDAQMLQNKILCKTTPVSSEDWNEKKRTTLQV